MRHRQTARRLSSLIAAALEGVLREVNGELMSFIMAEFHLFLLVIAI